jgi:hypothetical protein
LLSAAKESSASAFLHILILDQGVAMGGFIGSLGSKKSDSSEESEGLLGGKVGEWLDELKKMAKFMENFGFTMKKFSFDMSMPPQINTSFIGTIDNIREEKIKQLIEEHQSEKLTVLAGKSLLMAKKFWERVEAKIHGVELNVTLGLTPSVSMRLIDPQGLLPKHNSISELVAVNDSE